MNSRDFCSEMRAEHYLCSLHPNMIPPRYISISCLLAASLSLSINQVNFISSNPQQFLQKLITPRSVNNIDELLSSAG